MTTRSATHLLSRNPKDELTGANWGHEQVWGYGTGRKGVLRLRLAGARLRSGRQRGGGPGPGCPARCHPLFRGRPQVGSEPAPPIMKPDPAASQLDLARRFREQEALLEIGLELAATLDLRRVLSLALTKAEEFCRAETSSIWELDEEWGELFLRIVREQDEVEI